MGNPLKEAQDIVEYNNKDQILKCLLKIVNPKLSLSCCGVSYLLHYLENMKIENQHHLRL
jgi:hypothetical protein